ncbi:MAG: glycoside hydrolase family 2 TIM barrel-domain containing protein, partial [Bacillota bacterium]
LHDGGEAGADAGEGGAEAAVAVDGFRAVDAVSTRFGVREARRGPNWELYLNGRRFFARGTNYLSRLFMSTATPQLYDRHLALVRELGMNLVRVFAHVELPYFYHRCDELGILVYQDLPLQWGYEQSAEVLEAALAMAEQMVTALRNHPCVIIWCCHSEPRLPDWLGLTRAVFRRVAEMDSSRILVKASVFAPVDGLTNEEQDEEAFEAYHRTALTVPWVGWYWDEIEDVEKYGPHFISEMGAQAVPDVQSLREMLPEGALWPPDWDVWKRHGFQLDVYRQNLGEPPDTLEALVARSQAYQARLLKSHVEAFRRKKYRPVNSVIQFTLTDCAPVISWSVVDFFGRPKAGYHALRTVMQPVLVSIQVRSESRVQAAPVDVNVWVINDYPHGFEGAELRWEVLGPDGALLQGGARRLDVPADSALEGVARLTLGFPRAGRYVIRAALHAAGGGRCLAQNESQVDVRAV